MKVRLTQTMEITAADMARALAEGTPEQFAAFWRHFFLIWYERRDREDRIDLDAFAQAMIPETGSGRLTVLKELMVRIGYWEEVARRQEVLKKGGRSCD